MKKCLAYCIVFCALYAPMANAETLIFTTEESPPLNLTIDGKISGSSTELIQMALKETGIKAKLLIYPWARAIALAKQNENTCVYSTIRTKEREPLFKWAGPLADSNWILLSRADGPKISSLEEAKKHAIGGYKDDALTNYLLAQGIDVDVASNDLLNSEKLRLNRIDLWGAYNIAGFDLAKRKEYSGLVKALQINAVSLYLACNKGVADATIDKLNAVFKKYRKQDLLKEILKKYQ